MQALVPLSFLALGAILVSIGLRVLSEHRAAFLANQLSITRFETIVRIFRFGGRGYFAILALIAGLTLLFAGVLLLLL